MNELLWSAHDSMQLVSADRNASGQSSQDMILTNRKTIAKIHALHA